MNIPRSLQASVPAIRAGQGLPYTFTLRDYGQGITANATLIDTFIVPPGLDPDRKGVSMRAISMVCRIASLGSGASSGTWDVKLMKGSTVLGKGSIAFGASGAGLTVTVDLRDATNKGIELVAGDVLDLNLDVAAGTLSGGAKGIQCHVCTEVYGLVG